MIFSDLSCKFYLLKIYTFKTKSFRRKKKISGYSDSSCQHIVSLPITKEFFSYGRKVDFTEKGKEDP